MRVVRPPDKGRPFHLARPSPAIAAGPFRRLMAGRRPERIHMCAPVIRCGQGRDAVIGTAACALIRPRPGQLLGARFHAKAVMVTPGSVRFRLIDLTQS